MRRLRCSWVVLVLVAVACSSKPLGGVWIEQVAGGKGMELQFEPGGPRLTVHCRPRADGTHDHCEGTYVLDGEQLRAEWTEAGKRVELHGTLRGDELSLAGTGDLRLEFRRSDELEEEGH